MAIIIEFPNLRMRRSVFAVGACFPPRSDPVYLWRQEVLRAQEMTASAKIESERRRRALLAEEARLIRQKAAEEFRSWFRLIDCSKKPRKNNLVPFLRLVR